MRKNYSEPLVKEIEMETESYCFSFLPYALWGDPLNPDNPSPFPFDDDSD